MKRSLRKKVEIVLWFAGSCGATLFSCGLIAGMIYLRKVNLGTLLILGIGIFAAWEGFKMFRQEKNSN